MKKTAADGCGRGSRRPRRDSNAQPSDSKSGTLSIELRGRVRHNYATNISMQALAELPRRVLSISTT
jgi:hypothetical protein